MSEQPVIPEHDEKKPYTTPELVRYGAIEDLTQVKPVGGADQVEPSIG